MKSQSFFGMLTNAITDAKLSKLVRFKMTHHEKLGIAVLLPAVTDRRILKPFFIQKIKNLLKGKFPCVIIFICEKVRVTKEHMVEQLTEDQVIF
jgi:hypothetical protein